MILTKITTWSKPSKLMCKKFFSDLPLIPRNLKQRSSNSIFRFPRLTGAFLLVLISSLAISCSQKRGIAEESDQQFYQDVTLRYLPAGKFSLQGVAFAKVDRTPGSDLIWFVSTPSKGAKIKILLNKGKNGIGRNVGTSRVQHLEENIRFLTTGDIDDNGVDDLVLITSSTEKVSVKILFNNGKGFFSSKHGVELPFIYPGIERVDLVDLDQDGDVDFIFTGSRVLNETGKLHKQQAQVLVKDLQLS